MGTDSPDFGPVFDMLQDSAVDEQFKALGYRLLPRRQLLQPHPDRLGARTGTCSPAARPTSRPRCSTRAPGPIIQRRLHIARRRPIIERVYSGGQFSWQALGSVRDEPGPKFVFAHILLPHPPTCSRATAATSTRRRRRSSREQERLSGQLGWTNDRAQGVDRACSALPEDQRPIIILQADEGPFTVPYARDRRATTGRRRRRMSSQMKYGILNAWYLPDGTDPGLTDSLTSVNTFPTLFRATSASTSRRSPTTRTPRRASTGPTT